MHNLRASEACEACESDVRSTQISLKNTPVSLKSTPVSLNSTQVSLNSSPVSLTVSSFCWGLCMPRMFCSCLARLARLPRMPRMPRWLAYCIHSGEAGLVSGSIFFWDQQQLHYFQGLIKYITIFSIFSCLCI